MGVKRLKDIYPKYFQKSRIFLYPTLGIKSGSTSPIETYLTLQDQIDITDQKLIIKFHQRSDPEFLRFEELYLQGNSMFHDYKELADGKAIYIFTMEDFSDDWNLFLEGKYSLLSEEIKKRIRDFYGINSNNYAFINSYLYPDKYISQYATFLSPQAEYIDEMKSLLKEVGELCDRPNFDKEELKVQVKALDFY